MNDTRRIELRELVLARKPTGSGPSWVQEHMKDQAIVCNIDYFDNEIQVDLLNEAKGVKRTNIEPEVDMRARTSAAGL
jgi:hypothetical protein